MKKRCLPLVITLTFLGTMLFTGFLIDAAAESERAPKDVSLQKPDAMPLNVPENSVLHLIPQTSSGLVYCPSLSELNHRINITASGLMPQSDGTELLATILAKAFGAGFQSLAELEEIGLDLEKDFAVFFTSLKPMHVSAVVHLTDPEAIKQIITAEAEGNASTEYKGVTFWSSAEGGSNFAILDNIFVFSQQAEVCQNVIDTRNGTMQAITHNPDYRMFLTDILKGTDQLGVFFDIEAIMNKFGGSLESMIDTSEDENAPLPNVTLSLFTELFDKWIKPVEQLELQFVSASLQLQDMDVQLKPFLKFRKDSEFLNEFKTVPTDLVDLDKLPNRYMLNGGFQGTSSLLVDISTFWFDVFPKDPPGQQKKAHPLFQEIKGFYESLADRWTFSLNFESSIVPDCLFVYELKDEQSTKTFMDEEFLKKLHDHYDAYAGKPIMHNGTEIKSYVFPNISETLVEKNPEFSGTLPVDWHWYYAFSDGQLLWTTGTSPESIKKALDRQTEMAEDKFSGNPSYQKLIETLGTDNNIFLAFSPIIAVKNIVPLLTKTDIEGAASIQMFSIMFMNLPDNYSVGFSAKATNNGIDAKLLLTLGDFEQLFQLFGMMFGAGQMQ